MECISKRLLQITFDIFYIKVIFYSLDQAFLALTRLKYLTDAFPACSVPLFNKIRPFKLI